MSTPIEGFAMYFMSMDPEAIVGAIEMPQGGDEDGEEDQQLREGLYLAVRLQPGIAWVICPKMAISDNPRLILLFLELSYDLWRVDPCLLLMLLQQLKQRANEETRQQMERELGAYKWGRERFESAEFAYFLLSHNF